LWFWVWLVWFGFFFSFFVDPESVFAQLRQTESNMQLDLSSIVSWWCLQDNQKASLCFGRKQRELPNNTRPFKLPTKILSFADQLCSNITSVTCPSADDIHDRSLRDAVTLNVVVASWSRLDTK